MSQGDWPTRKRPHMRRNGHQLSSLQVLSLPGSPALLNLLLHTPTADCAETGQHLAPVRCRSAPGSHAAAPLAQGIARLRSPAAAQRRRRGFGVAAARPWPPRPAVGRSRWEDPLRPSRSQADAAAASLSVPGPFPAWRCEGPVLLAVTAEDGGGPNRRRRRRPVDPATCALPCRTARALRRRQRM